MPQPCYDEHCAVDSCVDSACAAESCTDVTCPETVHCNATCFDSNCLYNFGDETAEYNSQDCGQGNCFGFLPVAPGMNAFDTTTDMLYHCPQAQSTHPYPPLAGFGHPPMPDHGYQHDHVDHNRHKRRRIQTNGYEAFDDQPEPWSDDQLDAMFSPQTFNDMPIDPSFSGPFDFNCDPSCHHNLKHTDAWAGEMASSLVSCLHSY